MPGIVLGFVSCVPLVERFDLNSGCKIPSATSTRRFEGLSTVSPGVRGRFSDGLATGDSTGVRKGETGISVSGVRDMVDVSSNEVAALGVKEGLRLNNSHEERVGFV